MNSEVVKMEDWSSARVADRLQLSELLYSYCRAIDRIDLSLLEQVFHEDATVDIGNYRGDPAGFIALVAERHPGVPRAVHMVTNVLVDFIDVDLAFSESWCLAIEEQPTSTGVIDRTFRVRYGDLVERRAGAWRIAHRLTVFDHISTAEVNPQRDAGMLDRHRGVRGDGDPIEKMRDAYGALGRPRS